MQIRRISLHLLKARWGADPHWSKFSAGGSISKNNSEALTDFSKLPFSSIEV